METKVAFKIGDTTVHAMVHESLAAWPTMLNVHDDEDTSVAAGKKNIERFGGRIIELAHTGERLITFGLEGAKYTFDPNRIFSDAGIAGTLKKHSDYSPAAHAAIRDFAQEYLKRFALDSEPLILALHNTVDGLFSVESFLPGEYLGKEAADAHVSRKRSKFDFFYVTEPGFFEWLKRADFNVVLQDNAGATEDGSLSVHFAKMGIPYVNIEAEMRHLDNQIEMLAALREMLRELDAAAAG